MEVGHTAEQALALAREIVGDHAELSHAPTLQGRAGVALDRRIILPVGRLVMGRGSSCGAILLDPDLSREHALVDNAWPRVTIADLGSKNGTYADGVRLRLGQSLVLRDGMELRLGGCVFEYADPAGRHLAELDRLAAGPPPHSPAPPEIALPSPARLWLAAAIALAAAAGLLWMI